MSQGGKEPDSSIKAADLLCWEAKPWSTTRSGQPEAYLTVAKTSLYHNITRDKILLLGDVLFCTQKFYASVYKVV